MRNCPLGKNHDIFSDNWKSEDKVSCFTLVLTFPSNLREDIGYIGIKLGERGVRFRSDTRHPFIFLDYCVKEELLPAFEVLHEIIPLIKDEQALCDLYRESRLLELWVFGSSALMTITVRELLEKNNIAFDFC